MRWTARRCDCWLDWLFVSMCLGASDALATRKDERLSIMDREVWRNVRGQLEDLNVRFPPAYFTGIVFHKTILLLMQEGNEEHKKILGNITAAISSPLGKGTIMPFSINRKPFMWNIYKGSVAFHCFSSFMLSQRRTKLNSAMGMIFLFQREFKSMAW